MAEYYGEFSRRADNAPRRSFAARLIDVVMLICSVLVALSAVMMYLSPYINPSSPWIFSIFGLAAPAIYLLLLLATLYWIIRWRWVPASIMLILVFIGLFKVTLFYKPEVKRIYEQTASERGTIKFMTYNVRYFYDDQGQSSADEVLQLVMDTDPDIVCMQEYGPDLADASQNYSAFMEVYPYSVGGKNDEVSTSIMPIFSKYPIYKRGLTRTDLPDDKFHEAIWADLLIGSDTVRVFNNHLHSTAIKASDNEFITKHQYLSDTAREVKIRSIVRRLRDNNILRAAEVDSISHKIEDTPYARIVCGDFNDTPMSYVYRKMAQGLNDAFREAGRGYSYTYRGFFNMLRIDYALLSDDFEILSYEVPDADYSDHRPIVVRMRYTPRH